MNVRYSLRAQMRVHSGRREHPTHRPPRAVSLSRFPESPPLSDVHLPVCSSPLIQACPPLIHPLPRFFGGTQKKHLRFWPRLSIMVSVESSEQILLRARVVELVDSLDSESSVRKDVGVQIPPLALEVRIRRSHGKKVNLPRGWPFLFVPGLSPSFTSPSFLQGVARCAQHTARDPLTDQPTPSKGDS